MEVKAQAKYIKMSSKKVRLVLNLIRGKDVIDAQHQLSFIRKKAKTPVLKLINSAVANAEHNFHLDKENLYIESIIAEEGATLKRWRSRAFGRSAPIRKRSTHISVVLNERVESKKTKIKNKKTKIEKPDKLPVLLRGEKPTEDIPKSNKIVHSEQEKVKEIFDERRRGKHRSKQHLDKLGLKAKKGFVNRIFRRKSV